MLPDTTRMGLVTLVTARIAPLREFYAGLLGLRVLGETAEGVTLGTDTPLLALIQDVAAPPPPAHATGLYHIALRVPDRAALGRVLHGLLAARYPLQGAACHFVSEALYLADPDGNGIEITADTPRETWRQRADGQLRIGTAALDAPGLLAVARTGDGPLLDGGSDVGHVHLKVADLVAAEALYVGVLGFAVMMRMPGALFVAAGGYHHHLGLNTWESRGGPTPAPGSQGLQGFTLVLPDLHDRAALLARAAAAGVVIHDNVLIDPWGHQIAIGPM